MHWVSVDWTHGHNSQINRYELKCDFKLSVLEMPAGHNGNNSSRLDNFIKVGSRASRKGKVPQMF